MKTPELKFTDNYKLFIENDEQRPLNKSHVRNLIASMTTHGFLESKPIQVYKEGSRFVIVDGHHRFHAARSLGYEVAYVVEGKKSQETMADVNSKVMQWKLVDFVRLYAERGIKSYQTALEYVDRGIPLSLTISLLSGISAASNRKAAASVKSGTFEIKETVRIDKILEIVEGFAPICPRVKAASFISSLATCLQIKEFDFDRFRYRLGRSHHLIGDSPLKEQALKYIEDVYNFKSREKQPIAFQASEVSRKAKASA